MTCTPQALVTAAICYTKMSKTELSAAEIYLLCQWANHLTPPIPGCQFQGLPWMDTPSLIFTGDEIGIQSPLHIPPPPPYDPTYAVLAWGTTSGVYSTQLTVPAANFNAPFALLTPPLSSHFLAGTTYYFVVRTFDNAGHCSELSNELSHLFPGIPHASTPVWLPTTEQVTWTDTNGTFTGDYPTFAANVSVVSLTSLVFGATGNLTSLTNLTTAFNLVTLDVNTNALTTLNCTGLAALTTLNCSSNASLTTLTLTGCTGLVTLDCSFCDIQPTLDVSPAAPSLTTLDCQSNVNISTLTMTGCTSLSTLNCSNTAITSLGITPLTALTSVDASATQLGPSLNVTGLVNLQTLILDLDANLTSIVGLTTCAALVTLDCNFTSLTALDVNSLVNLVTVVVTNTSTLLTFDAHDCTALTGGGSGFVDLATGIGSLQSIDVHGCTALVSMDCFDNQLTFLNVAGCSSFNDLPAQNNLLPVAQVDDVLHQLALAALGNMGTLKLNGTGNASPTGGALNADYLALTGAGWAPVLIN